MYSRRSSLFIQHAVPLPIYSIQALVPVLSHLNPVHPVSSSYFRLQFIVTSHVMLWLPNGLFIPVSLQKPCIHFLLHHTCHMPLSPTPHFIFPDFKTLIIFMTSAKYYSGDKFLNQAFGLHHTCSTTFHIFIYNTADVR